MKYKVTGYINNKDMEFTKEFKSLNKANRYLDSILQRFDCQVEDSYVTGKTTKYVCNDYTRFYVEERN